MARKLEISRLIGEGDEAPTYGKLMLLVLQHTPPGEGLTLAEVFQCVKAAEPIERALAACDSHAMLEEEHYRTLRDKLQRFRFGIATPEIAEFGRHILDAPESALTAPAVPPLSRRPAPPRRNKTA